MNVPPMLMNVRVKERDQRFGIWIPVPLFLALLLGVVVLIVLSPLILIAALILWPSGWGKSIFVAIGIAFSLYNGLRGLAVDIRGPQQMVKVSVI